MRGALVGVVALELRWAGVEVLEVAVGAVVLILAAQNATQSLVGIAENVQSSI